MSDIDPTPDTPTTLGDRLGWFRGDVAADLATLIAAQLALRGTPEATLRDLATGLADLSTGLGDLAADLAELRGTRAESLTTVTDALFTQTTPRSPYLLSIDGRLTAIEQRLDLIQAGIGAVPYNSLEIASVRGLLNSLLGGIRTLTSGAAPSTIAGDTQSTSNIVVAGRRYARFTPPINGVNVDPNGYDLTRQGGLSWLGYEAYVQTTAPEIQIAGATDAPNAWLPLAGAGTINFSVDAAFPIAAFLRPLQVGQKTFNSNTFALNTLNAHGVSGQRLQDAFGVAFTNTIVFTNNNVGTFTPPSLVDGGALNWTFRITSGGTNALFVFKTTAPNVGSDANTIPLPLNTLVTISQNNIGCWYLQANSAFTIEITRP